ncbi:uncharacterized protein [Branchiostoma lanceolatum]|uniref:uncharacterized protein isoform X1 n=1 Tax=Branchiostoma lanceolatum TaxID=7740 RepID=UPI0034521296
MKVYTCALLAVVLMAVAKESSAAEYKGCYVKNYWAPYFPYSLVDGKMSNDMCVQYCKAQGKAYAATKSVRCGCGTEEHVAEMTKAADERQCSYNCKAGGGTCGGYARLSVYSTAQAAKNNLLAKKWREDLRCGQGYPAEDGTPAECDPSGKYPCCSPANWCGNTANHCDCPDCVNYRNIGKRMLNLREVLGDLTDTLEKLENAYKREMGETGDFEEEMREMEDMVAADMFEE